MLSRCRAGQAPKRSGVASASAAAKRATRWSTTISWKAGSCPTARITRIAAQATDEERLAIADVVIDNGGPVEETLRQVDELWASIRGGA